MRGEEMRGLGREERLNEERNGEKRAAEESR